MWNILTEQNFFFTKTRNENKTVAKVSIQISHLLAK